MEPSIDFFDNKKIVITGGGGYLGSKLAERLTGSRANIYLFDIKFNLISTVLAESNSNIKLFRVDITKKLEVEDAIISVNPDYVFHFAARLNRERDFDLYPELYSVNVNGTLNILESLKNISYTRFCFASSSEIYGVKNSSPFHEEQIPSPVSPYSLTKVMAEDLIKTFSGIYLKPFTILRIFNYYGKDMSESFFINQLISTLRSDKQFSMTGGEQIRDYLYIEDLLNAVIGVCISEQSRGEIINICSGEGVKLKNIAIKIAQKMGKIHLLNIGVLPYRKNEIWEMVGNNTKLSRFNAAGRDNTKYFRLNELL
jgi:nucleoside-diphosphate-sugar epimerase